MILDFLSHGILDLPWWGWLLATLALTQTTIAAVTLYLHRSQAHRGLDFHPLVSHFFRFWLWLTTGMVTKEWVAIHRKHHARCETEADPHSPQVLGLKKVLLQGSELYRRAAKDEAMLTQFGKGTPNDWIERNLYSRFSTLGISIMLVINVLLFGVIGIAIWAVQMAWIPIWAAGVINGVGHYFGYRNFENEDASTNLVPWGLWIGGEELHNNHHTFGTSCKFSYHWYEVDIGWMYICLLRSMKLATVRKVAPKLAQKPQPNLSIDTLQAIIHNRYALARRYAQQLHHALSSEIAKLKQQNHEPTQAKTVGKWLQKEPALLSSSEQQQLATLTAASPVLAQIYQMRRELSELWGRSSLSSEELLLKLQQWCQQAESSGIESLANFAQTLRQAASEQAA